MKYNLKEQLFDKIRGLEFVNPDEYGAKYNRGVREAKARVDSFFNKELEPEVPQYVATDLVLVGDDWWIERAEYDGSEWWEFKSIPVRKQYMKNITNLHKGMWDTLKDMNEDEL